MAASFSRSLSAARREAGFKTAYQFFHKNGGRRHFGFTYVHYLRIENAGRLPRPEKMARVLSALRLSPGADGGRALLTSYLKDLLRMPEAAALILDPLLCRHGGPAAAGGEALGWMKAQHSVHLSPEQFQAIASSEEAYWCSEVLCNDGGSWTAEELAGTLGFGLGPVRAGLSRLKAAGLARRTPAGRYRSPSPGKLYTFPGRLAGMGPFLKRIQGYWKRMERRRGGPFSERVELVRAESGFMRRYAAGTLAAALDAANAGAAQTKGEDTGFYLVEANVRRLLPF